MLQSIRTRIREIRSNDDGFTLTELLITIVILGVLAGIVVFAVATFTDDGKAVACETDYKNVEVAVEAYYARVHAYPATLGALVTAGYLKEPPQTTQGYTIGYDATTGHVSATGKCTHA